MEKIKLLAIAPYAGMRELIMDAASLRDDVKIDAYVGDLERGLTIAHRAVSETEYDMIISRGGTAELISRELNVPLLEVSISLGDILQAVKLAENYREKFAIVGFPSITNSARLLCDMLNYDIGVYVIHEEGEAAETLRRLRSDGYSMVVCDMITSTLARAMRLNAVLITSGAESVRNVIEQAVKLCRGNSAIRERNELYLKALRGSAHTIIFNGDGGIEFSSLEPSPDNDAVVEVARNEAAVALTRSPSSAEKVVGSERVSVRAEMCEVRGRRYAIVHVNAEPCPVFMQDACVKVLGRDDIVKGHFNHYYASDGMTGNLRSAIKEYSASALPVLITGEAGTGKDSAAAFIYENGPFSENLFYKINCRLVNDKNWQALVENPSSPLYAVGVTIYFNEAGRLSPSQLESLITMDRLSNLCRRNKIICSFVMKRDVGMDPDTERFINRMSGVMLSMPPLRERGDDMASLAALYIGQLNSDLGKQITGFEPDALEMLRGFSWPNNLEQFRRVLRELVVSTPSFHISKDAVAAALKKEVGLVAPVSADSISLDGTLDEITHGVIRAVLEREGGSQKRASERLGISRSTIWRILNAHK